MKFQKKKTVNAELISQFAKQCRISTVLSELLLAREIDTPEKVKKYLYGTFEDFSSPYIFPDMEKIVARIRTAMEKKEKIVVYGDYDCDGVGAIAIFTLSMLDNGYNVSHYIPTRATEGYGLNKRAIEYIKETYSPDLLVTVDCGINAIEEVEYVKKLGMDIIVTDHHTPSAILPDCLTLNPFLADNSSPLCGAGVVFTLIYALFGWKQAYKYIDICAISTIADIVPLTGDNRLIVKMGLEQIRKGRCRPGIKELLYSSKTDYRTITTGDVGFKIAPRINAAGRLSSAELSLSILLEEDTTSLHMNAEQLTMLNSERQEKNSKIYDEAMEMLKEYDFSKYKIIMLSGDWEEGIVGIVCAKLVEFFNLPAILVCKQEGQTVLKGSARSIQGINLYELFDKNNSKLTSYGGHEMAAGISFEQDVLQDVLEEFNTYIINNVDSSVFDKKSYYDLEMNISDVNAATLSELNLMEPFGHKNNAPVFLDTSSGAKFKQIGQSRHVKAKYAMGDLVAFDKLKYADATKNNKFHLTYTVEKNFFNGKTYTQFMMKDMQFVSFTFSQSQLAENFCKTFLTISENDNDLHNNTCQNIKSGPNLVVTFDSTKVPYLLKKYNTYKAELYGQSGCCLSDVIAISPDETFPYAFYSNIIFEDKIDVDFYKEMCKSGKNISYSDKKIPYDNVDLEDMRRLYVSLKNMILPNKKCVSAKKLFEDLFPMSNNDEKRCLKFILGFYILVELGLITISKDDIIEIVNKKVELTKSKLYQYINR